MDKFTVAQKGSLSIRKMKDCTQDYALLSKWLSDPVVAEYYEGRTKLYDCEMVLEKFGPYARGEEPVCPCIVEYAEKPIGYIQYYVSDPKELTEFHVQAHMDISRPDTFYGFDVFIGEPEFWNQGIGTQTVILMTDYLFQVRQAQRIIINPQTWNKRAIRCYEKCGFSALEIIKEAELHDDVWMDCLIMWMGRP